MTDRCSNCGANNWKDTKMKVDGVSGTKITVWRTCQECGHKDP